MDHLKRAKPYKYNYARVCVPICHIGSSCFWRTPAMYAEFAKSEIGRQESPASTTSRSARFKIPKWWELWGGAQSLQHHGDSELCFMRVPVPLSVQLSFLVLFFFLPGIVSLWMVYFDLFFSCRETLLCGWHILICFFRARKLFFVDGISRFVCCVPVNCTKQ